VCTDMSEDPVACHQGREVVGSSETSVFFYQAIWHHIPEDRNLRTSYTICSYALKVKYIQGYKQTWVLLFETCKTDQKGKSQTFI